MVTIFRLYSPKQKQRVMKRTYLLSAATAVIALAMTACGGSAETTENEEAAAVTYTLDSEASSLKWKGDAADDSHSHEGTVKISEGTMVFKGETFESGNFKVDLKTVDSELDAASGEDKLVAHLANTDFFNSDQFPVADVTITTLTDTEATATISVAGKKTEATFPVKTNVKDDKVTVKGKFDVDFTFLNAKGFTPDPAMEAKHKGSYISPLVHFDLDATLKAPSAK